jgi:hypothetical protein
MTFDSQRPVMAHGQLSAAGASCWTDWVTAEIRSAPPRTRASHSGFVSWCPGLRKRVAAAAGASVLWRVGAVR